MTSSFETVLIVGGTSGIGEAFARRLHALGKRVIVTGRRQERLALMQRELKGLEVRLMDVSDLTSLSDHVSELTKAFPAINTVLINAGIQKSFSFTDPSTCSNESIVNEITTNITAPMILTRLFTPHLLSLDKPASILLVSSGLAFLPIGYFPVYCATKAAVHSFAVSLRQQMKGTNVSVVEIVPPYVDTGLDAEHRERINQAAEGKGVPPMALGEYMDKTMAILEKGEVEELREVGVGSAEIRVSTWRGSFGKILEQMGIDA
jgi:uncharacterized oxidoreductase